MNHFLRNPKLPHAMDQQQQLQRKVRTKGVTPPYMQQNISDRYKTDTPWGPVSQRGPTLKGQCSDMPGYQPARDCNGYFTASKYQADNNSYNYGVIIATNTIAQPGRASDGTNFYKGYIDISSEVIQRNAERDGLEDVGRNLDDMMNFESGGRKGRRGHYVAMFFSEPRYYGPEFDWKGDFLWLRLDTYTFDSRNGFSNMSWSYKDGIGEMLDFDAAGAPITNPMNADFNVREDPVMEGYTINYTFHCFMFVPHDSNGIPTPNII